jgi:hypothetical protein
LKDDLVGLFLFDVVDTVIFYDDINWYYYSLLINKAELVEDDLQTLKRETYPNISEICSNFESTLIIASTPRPMRVFSGQAG